NGTAIGTVAGGTAGAALGVTFNATAAQAGVQAVVDSVAYANSNKTPALGDRHVVFQFTDGNGSASLPAVKSVNVTPAAAIAQLGAQVTYAAGSAPVVLASGAVVSDTGNAFANSTLAVNIANFSPGRHQSATGDQLSIAAGGGVTLDGTG